eukprot:TRINITY_DN11263_c0_g1_i2.p1 TRINITY_DN11263_c0_g1~~TRINITY_DN11263_c0_g1_i2.p1  ORF type:complete len:608 (+),score=125.19 TRINITY_DN11263_c0_g1_i2:1-1824(+)
MEKERIEKERTEKERMEKERVRKEQSYPVRGQDEDRVLKSHSGSGGMRQQSISPNQLSTSRKSPITYQRQKTPPPAMANDEVESFGNSDDNSDDWSEQSDKPQHIPQWQKTRSKEELQDSPVSIPDESDSDRQTKHMSEVKSHQLKGKQSFERKTRFDETDSDSSSSQESSDEDSMSDSQSGPESDDDQSESESEEDTPEKKEPSSRTETSNINQGTQGAINEATKQTSIIPERKDSKEIHKKLTPIQSAPQNQPSALEKTAKDQSTGGLSSKSFFSAMLGKSATPDHSVGKLAPKDTSSTEPDKHPKVGTQNDSSKNDSDRTNQGDKKSSSFMGFFQKRSKDDRSPSPMSNQPHSQMTESLQDSKKPQVTAETSQKQPPTQKPALLTEPSKSVSKTLSSIPETKQTNTPAPTNTQFSNRASARSMSKPVPIGKQLKKEEKQVYYTNEEKWEHTLQELSRQIRSAMDEPEADLSKLYGGGYSTLSQEFVGVIARGYFRSVLGASNLELSALCSSMTYTVKEIGDLVSDQTRQHLKSKPPKSMTVESLRETVRPELQSVWMILAKHCSDIHARKRLTVNIVTQIFNLKPHVDAKLAESLLDVITRFKG